MYDNYYLQLKLAPPLCLANINFLLQLRYFFMQSHLSFFVHLIPILAVVPHSKCLYYYTFPSNMYLCDKFYPSFSLNLEFEYWPQLTFFQINNKFAFFVTSYFFDLISWSLLNTSFLLLQCNEYNLC